MVAKKSRTQTDSVDESEVIPPEEKKKAGAYFIDPEKDVKFISSGSTLLNQILSGGWALGRCVNIVGDKSAGKTLLAIEACANFAAEYPKGKIWYNEAEAAFDENYASALGLPVEDVFFVSKNDPKEVHVSTEMTVDGVKEKVNDSNHTVEGLFEHLQKVCNYHEKHGIFEGIYVIDSLDAFSDRAELDREIDQGTFGQNKAKKMSELFRRLVRKLEKAGLTVIVVSQVRDNIGVTFGSPKTRSGGRALDFYASQIIWLAEKGKIKKTIKGVERVVGVDVRAQCKKNKVGMPFRECEYSIEFGYGIDDLSSCAEWLSTVKDEHAAEKWNFKKDTWKRAVTTIKKKSDSEFFELGDQISRHCVTTWRVIEEGFMPTRSKYRRN